MNVNINLPVERKCASRSSKKTGFSKSYPGPVRSENQHAHRILTEVKATIKNQTGNWIETEKCKYYDYKDTICCLRDWCCFVGAFPVLLHCIPCRLRYHYINICIVVKRWRANFYCALFISDSLGAPFFSYSNTEISAFPTRPISSINKLFSSLRPI